MKVILAALAILIASSAFAQTEQKPIRIFMTTSETPSSIQAISTADISRAMTKKCSPNVTLTRNSEKADYSLEAVAGSVNTKGRYYPFSLTLFDKDGNVVFTTGTRWLENGVKDVCVFLRQSGTK